MECCVLLNVTAGNGGGVLENHPYVQELYPSNPDNLLNHFYIVEPFITFISTA
jgi:hypothetical protein